MVTKEGNRFTRYVFGFKMTNGGGFRLAPVVCVLGGMPVLGGTPVLGGMPIGAAVAPL